MEGPSLVIAAEQLQSFKGRVITAIEGNTSINKEVLLQKELKDLYSWGKHLILQFDTFALKVHFLLFGTYEAVIDGVSVSGDYKRTKETRLTLIFPNGTLKIFNGSVKILENSDLKNTYDFSLDIMSDKWDSLAALKSMKQTSNEQIGDLLLEQEIFSGVGNIIKNEVLSMTFTHPKTLLSQLSDKQLRKIITTTRKYSLQFYEWKKAFVLKKHFTIYRKSACPHCKESVVREKTGKKKRWSFYCPVDQKYIENTLFG